jgi:hypothetical protein
LYNVLEILTSTRDEQMRDVNLSFNAIFAQVKLMRRLGVLPVATTGALMGD